MVEPSLAYQSVVRMEWTLLGSVWLGMCGLPNTIRRKRGPGGLVGANTFGETLAGVIPWSENAGAKPLYMFTRCSNHTYSNNIITDAIFDKTNKYLLHNDPWALKSLQKFSRN